MGPVLGDLLPLAVGVAISPIPIVAAILMILSKNAGGAAKGFAAGWVAGILAVTVVVTLIAGSLSGGDDKEPSAAVSWIKIVVGAGLIVLAATQWSARSDTEIPPWMRAVDTLTTVKATGLGALLSGVNPKNLLLCVSAGLTIGGAGLGAGGAITAIVVFTLLASLTVLAVVLGYLVAADRLGPALNSLRTWLQDNNHAVMAIVLVVMGAVVLGKGIGGL
ncbi:GAP family protein [Nocardia rhizosphaerae]|uniref:GAP family protein n=1 Tax=Nocardia rhizosphaerae TaxID=1691571 RepID=A0ABV8L472_9NOCA